jgi:cytochrome c-type biogenesis protein CcmH/NrfG
MVVLMQIPPGPDSMLGIGQGRKVALFTALGMTVGAGMIQLPLYEAEYMPDQAAFGSPRRRDCQPGQSLADHLMVAFLPQFVDPHGSSVTLQMLLL